MAEQVHLQEPAPLGKREGFDGRVDPDACVVDEGAKPGSRGISGDARRERSNRGLVRDVEHDRCDVAIARQVGTRSSAHAGKDVEAPPGKLARGGSTDAGRRAGHHDDLPRHARLRVVDVPSIVLRDSTDRLGSLRFRARGTAPIPLRQPGHAHMDEEVPITYIVAVRLLLLLSALLSTLSGVVGARAQAQPAVAAAAVAVPVVATLLAARPEVRPFAPVSPVRLLPAALPAWAFLALAVPAHRSFGARRRE